MLKVIKSDGVAEDYISSKILRTLHNCLAKTERDNITIAEQLTEAITFYLYNKADKRVITSSELHSVLKIMLASSGFEDAAENLHEHHYHRLIKRSRVFVVDIDIKTLYDAKMFHDIKNMGIFEQWNKSKIVEWVRANTELDYLDARAVASAVEEKIFTTNLTCLTTGLIRQFVLAETAELMINSQPLNIQLSSVYDECLIAEDDCLAETINEEEYVMI
jgi:transcriptional regulator NrdR family protein